MKKKSFDEANFSKRQNALYLYALKFAFRFSDDLKTAEPLALHSLAEAQKELPAASKRAFRKILKRMILQNCAAYEDDPNAHTPSPVQKAYEKYQNGRKRKKRFLAVTAVVLAALIVAAILCATLIPAALNDKQTNAPDDTPSVGGISIRTPFLIGEMYKGSDKSITFFGISAHNTLTIEGETYDGYYLIASAIVDSEEFYPASSPKLYYFQNDESLSHSETLSSITPLTVKISNLIENTNKTNSMPTSARSYTVHGVVNFVYELTQKQYKFLYEARDTRNEALEARHQGEIDISFAYCRIPSRPGVVNEAFFTFFYHQIRFDDPPEEESGETEQPSGNESDTNS